jgi:hypothetical protein
MIDTDKYEGNLAHLDYELWAFTDFMNINATHEERCATDALLNDAPLLLEEVKRLQSIISVFDEYMMNDFMTDFSRSEAHAIWNELVRGDGI